MIKTRSDLNHPPMSIDDAEKFVKVLLEDVFPNGKVELIDEFYTQDVVGHFNNHQTLNIQDIKDRVLALKTSAQNCLFKVNQVSFIGQLIGFTCRQSWVNKHDLSSYDCTVFGIYRICNQKICELWLLIDSATESYQTINQNYPKYMAPFESNYKLKQEFLIKLKLVEKLHLNKSESLSDTERECLYYYFNGFSAKECAACLGLSKRTVETYLAIIKNKFNCLNKHELRKKLFPIR